MGSMKEKKQLTAPEWVVKEFESRRRESHEMNVKSLQKAIKRRERIRTVLALGGALVAFCGAGSMEFSDLTPAGVTVMVAGFCISLMSLLIVGGDLDE